MRHRLSASSFRLFAALIAALLAAGVVIAPTAAAAGLASISGTVRAAVDGAPLAGATVEAFLTPTSPHRRRPRRRPATAPTPCPDSPRGRTRSSSPRTTAPIKTSGTGLAQTATDAQPLTLASGDSTPFIDGYLADATTSLTGTVHDLNSTPIQASPLACIPPATRRIRSTPCRRPQRHVHLHRHRARDLSPAIHR